MTAKRSRILLTALFAITALGLQPAIAYNSNSVLPTWANSATIYEVNVRQYTEAGTFKAFEANLPRLQKLGVKILWLMPIHPISKLNRKGSLGSPYSIADYKGVNPEFGNETDFKSLVTKAHALGFKVILDWVANHSGWDNPWTVNKSWYHTDSSGNIVPPNNDWTDVAWLNYKNQDMRRAMIDAMSYWVKTFDVDGFRADVAGGVPTDFWKQANTQLQAIRPLFMLAEDQSTTSLLDDAFITNYNWELKDLLNAIAAGYKDRTNFDALACCILEVENGGNGLRVKIFSFISETEKIDLLIFSNNSFAFSNEEILTIPFSLSSVISSSSLSTFSSTSSVLPKLNKLAFKISSSNLNVPDILKNAERFCLKKSLISLSLSIINLATTD